MTDKEIDRKIHELLDLETRYEIRLNNLRLSESLSLKEANLKFQEYKRTLDDQGKIVIVSEAPIPYHFSLDYAITASADLATKYDCTFVLTYTDHVWKATFGDYKDCEEVIDDEPARAICLATIKFLERVL